jgi:aspartyl-tRNA(Asn)/glutamyl-tRNA(Gln) amidotransferase subunit A
MIIGVPFAFFSDDIQPGVLSAVTEAIRALEKCGAVIKEITFPKAEELEGYRKAHQTVLLSGAYTVHERDIMEHSDLIAPEILERMKRGNGTVPDFIRSLYARPRFKELVRKLMDPIDIVMMPTLPITATDIDAQEVTIAGRKSPIYEPYTRFTWIGNFTGFPALSLPCGMDNGLPVGVQFIGHEWAEDVIYWAAAKLEETLRN